MSLENGFLPVNMAEVEELGLKQLDFVYVSGDAYIGIILLLDMPLLPDCCRRMGTL